MINARKHCTHSKWLEKHMTIKTCYSQITYMALRMSHTVQDTDVTSYHMKWTKAFEHTTWTLRVVIFTHKRVQTSLHNIVSGHMVQRTLCIYSTNTYLCTHTHVLSCSLLSWESEKIAFAHILMLDPFLLHTQLRLNVKLCCRYSQNQKCTFWLFSSQLMHHIICQRHTLIFPKSWSVYK